MARSKSEKCSDVIQILGGANHDTVREDEDFYATPTMAVQKLIDNFGFKENDEIYDPCVGKGHILKSKEEILEELKKKYPKELFDKYD